jgi:hypothetical protein
VLGERAAQVVDRRHAELGAQLAERLRPEPLDPQQRDHARRVLRAQRLELLDLARLEQLADLRGGALADPVDLLELLHGQTPRSVACARSPARPSRRRARETTAGRLVERVSSASSRSMSSTSCFVSAIDPMV